MAAPSTNKKNGESKIVSQLKPVRDKESSTILHKFMNTHIDIFYNQIFELFKGAGVVTSRAHVHYVVTEYGKYKKQSIAIQVILHSGIANLWGRNIRQRAFDLIRIAHPNHRERLEKEAFERLGVSI